VVLNLNKFLHHLQLTQQAQRLPCQKFIMSRAFQVAVVAEQAVDVEVCSSLVLVVQAAAVALAET
jgi:hypothetical protein